MPKKPNIKIITIAAMAILLGGAIFLFWNYQKDKEKQSGQPSLPLASNILGGLSQGEAGETIISPEVAEKLTKSELNRTYYYPQYRFSFQYPGELNASAFQEGDYGHTVLVQQPNERAGFQIFIASFDEAGPITKERILRDLPDMVIDQPQHVIIGQDKITALIFFSHEPSLGRTREVWFIYGGHLYQMSTFAGLDGFIGRILETWKFQ